MALLHRLDDLLVHAARRALQVLEAAVAAYLDLTAALLERPRAAIRRHLPATHSRELRAIRHLVDSPAGPIAFPCFTTMTPTRCCNGKPTCCAADNARDTCAPQPRPQP